MSRRGLTASAEASLRADLDALRLLEVTLPDGRRLEAGQEVKVSGEPGAFRFRYAYRPDGSLTFWGPVDSQHAQWRSFSAESVRTIHRKAKSRARALEVAS